MPKLTRLLFVLFLAFAPILTFTPTAQAEPLQGLGVDVYTFDPSALPEIQPYTLCDGAWTSVPNVNHDWGGDIVAGCQSDFVVIHYYGYITLDYSGDVWFQSLADDGFFMSINDETVINDWNLKGCSGSSGLHSFEAGVSQKFDAWWYEYGGGACNILYANVDSNWGVVSESAFSRDAVVKPPVIDPPVVEPPIIDPPIVEPPIVDPPVVDPPIIVPPVVEPIIPDPPIIVPPVIEPEPPIVPAELPLVKPEPKPEPSIVDVDLAQIDPQSLSKEDMALLTNDALKTFETAMEGSAEYNQALEQLMIVAQADDIVISEELASVPVLGSTIVGLTNAFNALGNFGADMSPKARHKAKQEVVAAVIVTQIATTAVGLTVSAPSSIRRIK